MLVELSNILEVFGGLFLSFAVEEISGLNMANKSLKGRSDMGDGAYLNHSILQLLSLLRRKGAQRQSLIMPAEIRKCRSRLPFKITQDNFTELAIISIYILLLAD